MLWFLVRLGARIVSWEVEISAINATVIWCKTLNNQCHILQWLFKKILWTLISAAKYCVCLRLGCAATLLLGLWVRIPPWIWMSVCCECCVFSGKRSLRRAHPSSGGVLPTVACPVNIIAQARKVRPWPGNGSKRPQEKLPCPIK